MIASNWASNVVCVSTANTHFPFIVQSLERHSFWHTFSMIVLTSSPTVAVNVSPAEVSRSIWMGVVKMLIKYVICSIELMLWYGYLWSSNLNLSHASDKDPLSSWLKFEIAAFLSQTAHLNNISQETYLITPSMFGSSYWEDTATNHLLYLLMKIQTHAISLGHQLNLLVSTWSRSHKT